MAAFVLETTEPDCHLLENKYFFKLYFKKKKRNKRNKRNLKLL